MPIASFRTAPQTNSERIDAAAGIIYGCQLVKSGKTARFANSKGEPDEIDITPELIKRLAELANGKTLNAHWTHDYRADEKDPLQYKIGAWKNVRIDGATGNLIGDLHLMPSEYREAVLWLADNTPDGAMMSIVFSFDRISDRHAMPVAFYAADIVEIGAASDSFFSGQVGQSQPKNKPMEPKQLIELLANPEVKTALFSAMLSDEGVRTQLAALAKADDKDEKKEEVSEAEEAALEKAQGVTDEDKKPEDAALSRVSRIFIRGARAKDRQIAAMAGDAAVRAEAALTGKIGNIKALQDLGGNKSKDEFETAVAAFQAAGAKSRGAAIQMVASQKPEVYNAHIAAGGAQ